MSLTLGRLKARGEGGDRRWVGWMTSPTRWTWVCTSSGRLWRTGKPGMLWIWLCNWTTARPTFSSSIHRRNWTLSGAVLSSPASVNTQGHVLHPLVVLTHRHWECHPYVPWPCTRPAGIRPTSAERSELNTHSAAEESSWDLPCWPESSPPELPGSRWPAVQSTFFSATTPALCPGIHRWLLDLHDSLLSGGPELTT